MSNGSKAPYSRPSITLMVYCVNLDPVRESVNKATNVMFGYMGGNAKGASKEAEVKCAE